MITSILGKLNHHEKDETMAFELMTGLFMRGYTMCDPSIGFSKKFKGMEVTIELCIGDNCVAIWDKDQRLIEGKYRCVNLKQAVDLARMLEENYFKA